MINVNSYQLQKLTPFRMNKTAYEFPAKIGE